MTDVYDVLEVVGQGSMGEVSVVTKKHAATEKIADRVARSNSGHGLQILLAEKPEILPKDNNAINRKYACKTINTVRFKDAEILEFVNEINILRELDHPNIIQLFEVFKKRRKMWIIMELCTGGDLSNRMNAMTEIHVAIVLKQIMQAISYMHNRNVCHRDIKLENILYADSSPDAPVMLIDFGLSNKFTKDTKMNKACGTIYTIAPEIMSGLGYREETDIWSIGCVAFLLLSGDYPFLTHMTDLRDAERVENLKNGRFTFGPIWEERGRSHCGRDFCTGCLKKDPAKRWTAKRALEYIRDVWIPRLEIIDETCSSGVPDTIQEGDDEPATSLASKRPSPSKKRTRMDTEMVKGMEKFVLYGELKKTILMTMAYTMDKSR
jgi:calcium-dependent protein kinase